MKTEHCPICDRQTMYKRHLGFGTLFAVLITAGFWILAIPFYPLRCSTCGREWRPKKGQFSWR